MFRRKPAPDLIRGGFAVNNMRHSINSAAAAEAAGAAVSQVFLAVRAGGRRNGRGRGEGQSKGQNELRHCRLLWVLVSFGGGRMPDRRISVSGVTQGQGAPSTWPDI